MKPWNPSAKIVIWAALLNAPTMIMAAIWVVLTFFATAIGSKPPSASEYMAMLWPAFAGATLACISLILFFRINLIAGSVLAIAGVSIMPIAFKAMMP